MSTSSNRNNGLNEIDKEEEYDENVEEQKVDFYESDVLIKTIFLGTKKIDKEKKMIFREIFFKTTPQRKAVEAAPRQQKLK